MKRALAKLFQWLADSIDPALLREHLRLTNEVARLGIKNNHLAEENWALRRQAQIDLPAGFEGRWDAESAAAFALYLETKSGKALSNHLRMLCAANAIDGARKSAETETVAPSCVAAGWDEAVRYLHSLSRVPRVEDTNPNDKTPPGEAELLEQLSP